MLMCGSPSTRVLTSMTLLIRFFSFIYLAAYIYPVLKNGSKNRKDSYRSINIEPFAGLRQRLKWTNPILIHADYASSIPRMLVFVQKLVDFDY